MISVGSFKKKTIYAISANGKWVVWDSNRVAPKTPTYRTTTGDASTSSLDCRCEEGNLVSLDGSNFHADVGSWGIYGGSTLRPLRAQFEDEQIEGHLLITRELRYDSSLEGRREQYF